ncbi:MAG: hypothetical protein COT43_02570 [Candidatus Marinimicrobia bacterium CG08_land_8_20_14_0_20_45_22]|nr:MAG: hypothetical protein COT43_02570 [Candidatus Marinimicrobia bacterium CG08_land_8_20_14_0_20_45_22]
MTQKKPSDDTNVIETNAPKTWNYLVETTKILDSRKSIIYRKRPRFSVFGIGDYTFSPWKVAISSLYTIDILNRIDLKKVSEYLNQTEEAHPLLSRAGTFENERQFSLVFEKNVKYHSKRGSKKK